jgi:DNA-directed RNA polymerase specialized sigma24 family protein
MDRLEHAMYFLKAAKRPCYDYLWSRYMLGWDNKMIAEAFGLNYDSVHVIIKRCLNTARALASKTD